MPTLNAAQTATVSLTVPNAYLTVDCSSGAVVDVSWVSAGSISGRRTVQNISEDVGPFTDQTTVTLYCRSGTASYSTTGDQATQAALQALVSGAGIVPAIFLGDSKTAQAFAPAAAATGYAPRWLVVGNAALGWPLAPINGGVSGNTTAQMLERLPALLAANPGPGWLVIRGMTNDIQSGNLVASGASGAQVTKEMIVSNLQACIDLGRAAGKRIALCTEHGSVSPFSLPANAATTYGALQRQAFAHVNGWVRRTCAANGYPLVDIEQAVNDPATGVPFSGALQSDGIHPAWSGGAQEARAFVKAFDGLLPAPVRSTAPRLSPRNLLGPVAAGAGSVTADAANDTRIIAPATAAGGIPSGWSILQVRAGGGAAGSKVARSGLGQGQAASFAFTSSASFGGAGFYIGGDYANVLGRWDLAWAATTAYAVGRRINANGVSYVCVTAGTTGGSDPTAGWATAEGSLVTDGATFMAQRKPLAGELLVPSVDIETASLVGNVTLRVLLIFRDTAGTDTLSALWDMDLSGGQGIAGNWLPPSMVLQGLPFAVPNSAIRYLFMVVAAYGENGSSATITVNSASVENISA